MPQCRFTRAAEEDLIGLWTYVATDDPEAATRLVRAVYAKCRLLAANPGLAPARDDIAPGLRSSVVGNYLVLYRHIPQGVEVVRVLHGARNLAALFGRQE
jgi:toxin ParE1/3/4